MTDTMKVLLRGCSVATVLLALGCAGPENDPGAMMPNGAVNHPIAVEPSYKSLKLSYSAAGLSNTDTALLRAFVMGYSEHGNGSIAVSAPANADSQTATGWFADQINALGVSRDHILVSTRDAATGGAQVEINYVAYQARTAQCQDWSENLAFTLDNSTPKNFGCSFQQNIAAQIADPRDLIVPRTMDSADATRRTTVLSNYEHGVVTGAAKHTADINVEQSAPGSDVGR